MQEVMYIIVKYYWNKFIEVKIEEEYNKRVFI